MLRLVRTVLQARPLQQQALLLLRAAHLASSARIRRLGPHRVLSVALGRFSRQRVLARVRRAQRALTVHRQVCQLLRLRARLANTRELVRRHAAAVGSEGIPLHQALQVAQTVVPVRTVPALALLLAKIAQQASPWQQLDKLLRLHAQIALLENTVSLAHRVAPTVGLGLFRPRRDHRVALPVLLGITAPRRGSQHIPRTPVLLENTLVAGHQHAATVR